MNKTLFTHRGMWALWDYNHFKHINSIEEFENTFRNEEDVEKYVKDKKFVPIYVHTNGEFQFRVKINEKLDKREKKFITATSKTYLFETEGKAYVSGIELIDNLVFDNEVIELNLEKGSYEVVVNLVEWDREKGMRLEDGSAHPDALPDFIIEINKVDELKKKYNTDINTFGKLKTKK
jgi:hypothetical protein